MSAFTSTSTHRPRAQDVSAEFNTRESVDRAVLGISGSGLPRDLIEVVVSEGAAQRFYAGVARRPGRETMRYAGRGGLIGLVVGIAIALAMVALGAVRVSGMAAMIQLMGPNLTTIMGAVIGGLVGAFVQRPSAAWHARAASTNAIVIVVLARDAAEADAAAHLLMTYGGLDMRITDHHESGERK